LTASRRNRNVVRYVAGFDGTVKTGRRISNGTCHHSIFGRRVLNPEMTRAVRSQEPTRSAFARKSKNKRDLIENNEKLEKRWTMNSVKTALIYGLAVWVIPFLVAIMIFPIRITDRPLFESIMPVVVALCVVIFSASYLRRVQSEHLKEGVVLGIAWLMISTMLDLLMFLPESPMRMDIADYMKDIGLTYLMIPTITIGFGYLCEKR